MLVSDKKILVIDNHERISNLYISSFEVCLNVKVLKFQNYHESKEYLNSCSDQIDVIIARSTIEEMNVDKMVYSQIKKNNVDTLLYVLGDSKLSIYDAKIFNDEVKIPSLIRSLAHDLSISPQHMASLDIGDFYEFKIDYIITDTVLICDLYVKNDEEYSLFLSKNDKLTVEVFSILRNQGHNSIYVRSEKRLKFINSQLIFCQELFSEDKMSLRDEIFISNSAYKLIRNSIMDMNISNEVITTTEKCIATIQSIVGQHSKLNSLFEELGSSKDVNFKQTILLAFICNHLIDVIEWGTHEQKVKLTFVAFFHNITLDSKHILINNSERLKRSNLSAKSKKEVLDHALNSARIVNHFKKVIPFGVDTIIKQHHGSVDGIGFNSFPQSISPLAIVFLVADEWVTNMLIADQQERKVNKDELMNIVRSKYKSLSFERVIEAFSKIKI